MVNTTQVHASTLTTLAADRDFFYFFFILDVCFIFAVPSDRISCISQRMLYLQINHIVREMPTYWPQPIESVGNASICHRTNGDSTIEHAWMSLVCAAVTHFAYEWMASICAANTQTTGVINALIIECPFSHCSTVCSIHSFHAWLFGWLMTFANIFLNQWELIMFHMTMTMCRLLSG